MQYKQNIVVAGSISSQKEKNDILINKIKRDVKLKAEKKVYLKESHPNKEIIIALVCDEQFPVLPDFKRCLELALFGTNNDGIFYSERTLMDINSVIGNYGKELFLFLNPKSARAHP